MICLCLKQLFVRDSELWRLRLLSQLNLLKVVHGLAASMQLLNVVRSNGKALIRHEVTLLDDQLKLGSKIRDRLKFIAEAAPVIAFLLALGGLEQGHLVREGASVAISCKV